MKDALLAEWTLLLERNKARFNRADIDKISPQIRAVLIDFQRPRRRDGECMAAESGDRIEPPDQIA
jgi:hypothetical protein